jgi:MFS family permease
VFYSRQPVFWKLSGRVWQSRSLVTRWAGLAPQPIEQKAAASRVGWYGTTVGLLQLVASVVVGLLWDRVGHAAVFYYGAGFAVVGCIGLLLLISGKGDRHNV